MSDKQILEKIKSLLEKYPTEDTICDLLCELSDLAFDYFWNPENQ
jgi:hypothetical protein